jgi:hypothetical protein
VSRRAHRTLLLVLRGFLARADFDRAGRARGRWSAPRSAETGDLVGAAAAALALGPSPARSAWLLTDEVFAVAVELPARSIRGLAPAELAQAVGFEVQAQTGLAESEALAALSRSGARGGVGHFAVTQLPRRDFEQVVEELRFEGAVLRGVLHPLGLPHPLHEGGSASFRRGEHWGDVRATVSGAGDGRAAVELLRAAPGNGAAEPEGPLTESLYGNGEAYADAAPQSFDLRDEAVLGRWFAGWNQVLGAPTRTPRPWPVVSPEARAPARVLWLAAGLLLAAPLVYWAAGEHRDLAAAERSAAAELQELRGRSALTGRHRARLMELRRELEDLEQTPLPPAHAGAAWSPELPGELLSVLAEQARGDFDLEALQLDWRRSTLAGRARTPETVDRLVQSLAATLAERPCAIRTSALRREGEHFHFELAIDSATAVAPAPTRVSE